MSDQLALLPEYLTAHLQLTLVALLIGTLVSVPVGIWITRRERLQQAVLGVASVIQTVPSLALLAVMVPAFAALGTLTVALFGFDVPGIGFLPALVALSLYSILPILRNTVTGIGGVDAALVEAARGVGMTPRQQLAQVELPLAMPVIVAGLRTSAVWVVGTATLSTPVGATSLGNYIFSGLQTRNYAAVLVGCLAAAALAMLLDGIIHALESGMRARRRSWVVAAGVVLALLYAYTGLSLAARGSSAERVVAIGSKTFTEQYILAEIMGQTIEANAGVATRAVPSLGSTVAFDALVSDDLDVYVDYSGTIWATIMQRDTLPDDRARVLGEVTRYLRDEHAVTVVGALGFENTYALGMRAAQVRQLGITTIGDLARHAPELRIGGDYEFFQRAEWRALVETYGLAFEEEISMDSSLMYQAVADGEVDVISAFSTDGRIAAFDIALVEDDRGVIPPYDAIVLISPRLPRELPRVVRALEGLVGAIDERRMQQLNLRVDIGGESPAEAARAFLASKP